eukprot:c17729_g1_i1.p1 GENE.c17729_g1_i1~~c17729_g1_i1.p1  ORF type:complete len:531 (+),score=157.51 c17729_g1_i1:27-1595(+)
MSRFDSEIEHAQLAANSEITTFTNQSYDISGFEHSPAVDGISPIIEQFLVSFYQCVKSADATQLKELYDIRFYFLTEKFFAREPWPSAENVAPYLEEDPVCLMLYKELYYRHIYSKLQPTAANRFESWANYVKLFNYILDSSNPVPLQLPNTWIWDTIDEFIYQFQSFHQYRTKVTSKSQDEVALLLEYPNVWSVTDVIGYLERFISKSKVLSEDHNDPFKSSLFYATLGYFSMVGLARVHTLLGDYYQALHMIDPIDLGRGSILTRTVACHITIFYYLGFCYLMTRRYVDAVKTFQTILIFISRAKTLQNRFYQSEQILKKNEQMCALLAICLALCPQTVEESLHIYIKEKYSDKIQRMQHGDRDTFIELFGYSCPKFITPTIPDFKNLIPNHDYNQEALRLQLKVFLEDVVQQAHLPSLRSLLKLYTTIEISKVAKFMDLEESELRSLLLCLKHKAHNLVCEGGPVSSGTVRSSLDMEFWIEGDVIHVKNEKSQENHVDVYLHHIKSLNGIYSTLSHRWT